MVTSIHPLWGATTPLICYSSDQEVGKATGFFFRDKGECYLVTNRHVLTNPDFSSQPDRIGIKLHRSENVFVSEDFEIPLTMPDGNHAWLEHPRLGANVDIVAIRINPASAPNTMLPFVDSAAIAPANIAIGPGDDVVVIGYPLGFFDEINNLPIARMGSVASAYGVKFRGEPHFLIDARLHSGSSGSPVFSKPSNSINYAVAQSPNIGDPVFEFGPLRSSFLGVFSATYHVASKDDDVDRAPNVDEPLGLGLVWYASLLQEIVEHRVL